MKKKIFLSLAMACSLAMTNAQDWTILGNAGTNAAINFVGTTDNRALAFRTNNVERMRILSSGNIGIGVAAPGTRLQINSGAAVNPLSVLVAGNTTLFADFGGGLSVGGGVSAPANGLFVTGNAGIGTGIPSAKLHINADAAQNILRAQIAGTTKLLLGSNGGLAVGSNSTAPDNGLFVNGSTGIGISTPATKLHVIGGTDVSVAGGGFMTLGITTTSNVAIDDNEIMARNNGVVSTLTLNNSGGNVVINGAGGAGASQVGIGTNSPQRELEVVHGTSSGAIFGLMVANAGSNNEDWTLYTEDASGDLMLYENGNLRGRFNDASGAYTAVSDRKMKQDIEAVPSVLNTVKQLEVLKYNFVNKVSTHKFYGLIAQDVEKLFPEIVEHVKGDNGDENYTMDYSAFGVLAIKAIQEQQVMIDELKATIDELKSMVKGSSTTATSAVSIPAGVRLEQNSPNPFTSISTIRYAIPAPVNTAQILITNSNGTVVKTFASLAKGTGSVSINGNELAAGTYYYSLVIDGKKADTKKMVLVK